MHGCPLAFVSAQVVSVHKCIFSISGCEESEGLCRQVVFVQRWSLTKVGLYLLYS